MTEPDYTQQHERPFLERTPAGISSYMLQALEAQHVIDSRETERLSILDGWGAISKTISGLHFSVLNNNQGCHIGTMDTTLSEEDQIPQVVYVGNFPKTQKEADDLVAVIAKACA